MIILKIRLTEGKHKASKPTNTGTECNITVENLSDSSLPEELNDAAWAIRKASSTPALRDLSDALNELVCNTCSGKRVLGTIHKIACPPCNGTGWKDGQDPTEIEE